MCIGLYKIINQYRGNNMYLLIVNSKGIMPNSRCVIIRDKG